jgi:hypothetical protein
MLCHVNPESSITVSLRHTLATLAYRASKAVRDAPAGFSQFKIAEGTRTPGEILAHIGDLLDWALTVADNAPRWHDSTPLAWDREVARFFEAMARLDERFTSGLIDQKTADGLFQAPIADALTHIGQISLLRRLAGSPVRGESYLRAVIVTGKVGPEQAAPGLEFD